MATEPREPRQAGEPREPIIYCARCNANTPTRDHEIITMRNGMPATIGYCVRCGTRKFHQGVGR